MARSVTTMTIYDVGHYTDEEREAIVSGWPEYEREARAKGIPQLGSGRVYPFAEEDITCEPFKIPNYWYRINAIDFGWTHPTAAVQLVWDKDEDKLYLTKCHRQKKASPLVFAGAVKSFGDFPWSWPHDGLKEGNRDNDAGKQLYKEYAKHGMNMLSQRATFEDGSNSREAGIIMLFELMEMGKFKVFAGLNDWFEEFRLYHRKDGVLVREYDDLLDATRYALMMKRYAKQSLKKKVRSYKPVTNIA